MTSLRLLQQHHATRRLLYTLASGRAKLFTGAIEPHLTLGDKVLDIGAGICDIDELLVHRGYRVTPLDIQNLSFNDLTPVLYDGTVLPFKDSAFDDTLILTVLHHTKNPTEHILEAKRVAKRVIIIEDVYRSTFRKYLTFFMDSLLNFEFRGHPHSNKTDEEWRSLFTNLHLKLVATKTFHSFIIMKHQLYVLESD